MKTILLTICLLLSVVTQAQQLAFPGADGYAKNVTGGRGGKVYYVTRTDDCPDNALVEGTLRWALNSGDDSPRTVLFAVNGTIYLTSKLKMNHPNVSILGQSAPGGGICLAGYPLNISKNNVIVRYVRFRAGDVPDTSLTGLSMENCQNVILDHCSLTWSMEECLTAYDSKYTTVQWCIIGEGLYNSKNSKGSRAYATQWGGEHSTMHHTLITNSHSRSPRFNGVRVYEEQSTAKGHDYQVDSEFANNVIYNWESYNSIYGGEMSGKFSDQYNRVYMISNYYRPGPATQKGTTSRRYWVAASAGENSTGSVTATGQWYLKGNKFETSSKWAPNTSIWSNAELEKVNADNLYGYDNNNASRAMGYWSLTPSASLRQQSIMEQLPYELSGMQYETADEAFRSVTTKAGAALPRYDEVDTRILAEAAGTIDPTNIGSIGGGKYGIIDSPDNVKLTRTDKFVANGRLQTNYPFLGMLEGDKYAIDSDADGMPDAYEDAKGFDKNNAADGAALAANGYTNLENYLNGIVDGTVNKAQYETSDQLVVPGTNSVLSGNFKVAFSVSDAAVEGVMPQAATASHDEPYVLPAGTMVYKEGYSFTGWTCNGTTYKAGEAVVVRADMTFVPAFTKNTLNISDRKSSTVDILWDFTVADAPRLAAGNAGVYVTSAKINTTNPATIIDARLKFDGFDLQVPSCKGTVVTLTYTDGTTDKHTADVEDALYKVTVNNTKTLKTVDVLLPKAGDGIYRYIPTCAVDASEVFYPTVANITAASEWMTVTNGTAENQVTALDPIKDDGTSTVSVSGVEVMGTTSTAKKLTFNITGVKELKVFTTATATMATVKTTPQLSCTPNDGTSAIIVKGTAAIPGTNQVLKAELDPNVGYAVTLSCIGDSRGRFVVSAIKMVRGLVTEVIPDPTPGPGPGDDPTPNPDKHDIFNAAPYDAQVYDVDELKLALTAAASRSDKEQRYRIFLHNGTYDFGSVAKTAIPAATSLVGESMQSVVIQNNPGLIDGNVSYQDKTPVLYIDSNQNDVYLQDLTIRQARDWDAKSSQGQALALRQRGSRATYKNVRMQGVQDTYYLNKSDATAYFETCDIAGEVDFIYGDGTMWFENCLLHPISSSACITASNAPATVQGIVFNGCTVEAEPTSAKTVAGYALGRPWNDSPAVTYLNTTMKVLPSAAGWKGMTGGLVVRFHEYASKDADGNLLDLSKRSISACSPAAGSDPCVLDAAAVAAYTQQSILGSWQPQTLTRQYTATGVTLSGNTLLWDVVDGAFCYAICKNGEVIAFSETNTSYDITESGSYSVRVANTMGGFGEPSAAVSTDGIESITQTATGYATYNLAGQRVSEYAKGIVVTNGKKHILK